MKSLLAIFCVLLPTVASFAAQPGWACIRTLNKYKYGRWEARVKVPKGSGMVPCIFLMDNSDTHWYEIDMEVVARENDFIETVAHVDVRSFTNGKDFRYAQHRFPADKLYEYQTHWVEWTPDHVEIGMDKPYRRSEAIGGNQVREISYETGNPGTEVRNEIFSDDWVQRCREANMTFELNIWAGCGAGWCGAWTDNNCGTAMFVSEYSHYSYTPGEGSDGSDWTLEYFDDFDGEELDTTYWEHFGSDYVLKDDVCVLAMNCDIDTDPDARGWDKPIPVDPQDSNNDDQTSIQTVRSSVNGEGNTQLWYGKGELQYTMEHAGSVKITIFDSAGRIVQRMGKTHEHSGTQRIKMEHSHVPAGTYIVQLTTSSGQTMQCLAPIQ